MGAGPAADLTESARASLRRSLLRQLSELCTPAIYALFDTARNAESPSSYPQFVAEMKAEGFRRLFDAKPVLLRLIATITRQWIDVSAELLTRLHTDLPTIRADLLTTTTQNRITRIEGDLGDPHNGGRSVRILEFDAGARIVYKPKDLRVDLALHTLVDRLNNSTAPVQLKSVQTLSRQGYGWCEFIEHTPCTDQQGVERYFTRAGAWLALLYCLAAGDMHQENIIAAGDHPVPIDIETILQAEIDRPDADAPESQAHEAAVKIISNSVMMVRLIPSYLRYPGNKIAALGGLLSDWSAEAGIDGPTSTLRRCVRRNRRDRTL